MRDLRFRWLISYCRHSIPNDNFITYLLFELHDCNRIINNQQLVYTVMDLRIGKLKRPPGCVEKFEEQKKESFSEK